MPLLYIGAIFLVLGLGLAGMVFVLMLEHPCGWQPIETAPMDGTRVLISCDEVYVASYDAVRGYWFFPVDGMAIDPDYWMPLPEMPA